jgi:hypothetical protein
MNSFLWEKKEYHNMNNEQVGSLPILIPSVSLQRPLGHALHGCLAAGSSTALNVSLQRPLGHDLQKVFATIGLLASYSSLSMNLPCWQEVHLVLPSVFAYIPASHMLQKSCPAASWLYPKGHITQLLESPDDVFVYFPMPQSAHVALPTPREEGQTKHDDEANPGLYRPTGQGAQLVTATRSPAFKNRPSAHDLHSVCAS